MKRKIWWLVVVIVVALLWLLRPLPPVQPTPSGSSPPDESHFPIHPEAETQELSHGHKTEDVFVLLHGITNTPVQFRSFADILFARGANVVVPRMSFHGHEDRLTDAKSGFTAQLMLDEANRAVDRAKLLGRRVNVMGLSVNGVTAAWIAQNRADVDTVVVMAPFFAVKGMPDWTIAPVARLFARLPNIFVWWDFRQRENLGPSSLAYPRFSTRAMAGVMHFGLDVFREAASVPPEARRIVVVTSAMDQAVSNDRIGELVTFWRRSAPGRVESYEFPADKNVPHDWMYPGQPDQQVETVYPILLNLLDHPVEPAVSAPAGIAR